MTDNQPTKQEELFLAKHGLTREYYKLMQKRDYYSIPVELRRLLSETNLDYKEALMLYFKEYRAKKSGQIISELKARNTTLEEENSKLREALEQYADPDNWGYYDESGCPKGHGDYTDACFIGPYKAQVALSKEEK